MNDWIDINERKPKDGSVVLVMISDDDKGDGVVRTSYFDEFFYDRAGRVWNAPVKYWMPLPEPPKKKRWKPNEGEKCFWINEGGGVCWRFQWNSILDDSIRNFTGLYRTEEEAEEMSMKIRRFVTEQIGEV